MTITASSFLDALNFLLAIPEYMQTLGWLFSLAMIIGAILDENGRELLNWILASAISVLFVQIARLAYLAPLHISQGSSSFINSSFNVTIVSILLVGIDATAGLTVGWAIVALAKDRVQRQHKYQIRLKEKNKEIGCND